MLQILIQGFPKLTKVIFKIFIALICLNVLLIIVAFKTDHYGLYGVFNLFYFDAKYNFPIYFSAFCLLLISVILYSIYRFQKQSVLRENRYWLVLSTGFLYLSIDESLNLHHLLASPLRNIFHFGGFLYYHFVILGIVICIILALYFFPWFKHLPYRYKRLFGISVLLYVGGAIVLEMFAARFAPNMGQLSLPVAIWGTIKQTVQWSGELVFLYALVDYLKVNVPASSVISI